MKAYRKEGQRQYTKPHKSKTNEYGCDGLPEATAVGTRRVGTYGVKIYERQ